MIIITLYKQTEELLKSYNDIKVKIKNLELEINEIKNKYYGIAAISYEEKTQSTNKFNSIVENEVINKNFLIEKLEFELIHEKTILEKIDNAINILTDTEKKVIESKCIKGLSYKQISQMLNLDYNYCYAVKRKAIKKLTDLILFKEKHTI